MSPLDQGVSFRSDPLYTRRHDRIDRRGATGGLPSHHSPLLPGDGVPFLIDLITLSVYAAVFDAPDILLPTCDVGAFLLVGVGIGATS
jgi:hypothetical protein